jgi:hypothetical protein
MGKMKIKESLRESFESFVWKPIEHSKGKRELNVQRLGSVALITIGFMILLILLLPAPPQQLAQFQERIDQRHQVTPAPLSGIEKTAQQAFGPSYDRPRGGGGSSSGADRNTTMIIARPGLNASTQLPAGTKFTVRLIEKFIVGSQSVPVIGIITNAISTESTMAIPEGAKLFGEATFDHTSKRARVEFKQITMPSGLIREFQAIAIGLDGQAGVSGEYHSRRLANAAGQLISTFIGGYTQGAMTRDIQGRSLGGIENGALNAVSETTKVQAEGYAEQLKNADEWVEVSAGETANALITQPFTFREPGGIQ